MDKIQALLGIFIVLLLVSFFMECGNSKDYSVGVASSGVSAKIDLTDQLNPQILPDVFQSVLAGIQVEGKPDTKEFQQKVVGEFSKAVMNDADVNYRVDLNEDGTIDPLMIVPEDVEQKAAVYSLRVADPQAYPQDPGSGSDWDKIAKNQSIELVQLAVTFDPEAKKVSVSATPNQHVYENSAGANYTQHYYGHQHNWIQTYFAYRLFSSMLFMPYGWGYGAFYGGYYGGYYRPMAYASRPVRTGPSNFAKAPASSQGLKSASGQSIKGSKAASSTGMPKSIKQMKSKRAMAVRKQNYSSSRSGGFGKKTIGASGRSGGFGSSGSSSRSGGFGGRSRSYSFGGGGSRGFGGK